MFIQNLSGISHTPCLRRFITINPKDALLPGEIEQKGLAIKEDIALVLQEAVRVKKEQNKEHGEA